MLGGHAHNESLSPPAAARLQEVFRSPPVSSKANLRCRCRGNGSLSRCQLCEGLAKETLPGTLLTKRKPVCVPAPSPGFLLLSVNVLPSSVRFECFQSSDDEPLQSILITRKPPLTWCSVSVGSCCAFLTSFLYLDSVEGRHEDGHFLKSANSFHVQRERSRPVPSDSKDIHDTSQHLIS